MKKITLLFFTLFFCLACTKEDVIPEPEPDPVPPTPAVDYFDGFHVKDTAGFEKSTIRIQERAENITSITGMKQAKLWIGLYNTISKEEIQTWSNASLFQGATSECTLSSFLSFEWGYAAVLYMGSYSIRQTDATTGVLLLKKGEKDFRCYDYSEGGGKGLNPVGDKVLVNSTKELSSPLYTKREVISPDEKVVINSVTSLTYLGSSFYSGFDEDDKMWFARVEENGAVIEEWRGTEVTERNVRLHLGYGEYRDHYIDRIFDDLAASSQLEMPWGYIIQPAYRESAGSAWVSGYLEYLFLKDGVVTRIPGKTEHARFTAWYNESVLVKTGIDKTVYTIYSPEGEVILERESTSNKGIYGEPVSYESYVQVTNLPDAESSTVDFHIIKYNIATPQENPVWDKVIKNVPASAKVTWNILEKNEGKWTSQFDLLYYSGAKETVTCVIDMGSGEITYL